MARGTGFAGGVQAQVRRNRNESQAVRDDLVEDGAHALVLLAVLGTDGPEVELHILDGHLGDVRQEDAAQGVRDGRRGVFHKDARIGLLPLDHLDLHVTPSGPSARHGALCRHGGPG